jgi:poly(hydroxyalkanoate) depolymerase family esterase
VLKGFAIVLVLLGSSLGAHPQAASAGPVPGCAVNKPAAWPAGEPGTVFACSYSEQGLTRTANVYQPTSWNPHRKAPLVVMLHGCTEQAADIAYISHYDLEAEKHGFIVLYPNQAAYQQMGTSFDGNGSFCWNWFLPQGQSRDAGEPMLIAGLTRQAITGWSIDRSRVFVLGISAGGATADIMAATYPDIYAATAILAGCEYRGLPCLGAPSAVPPQVSGQLAYQAAPGHQRVVPFLIENGDVDPAVPVGNAFEIAQQWQITADYALHGGNLSSPVPSAPCANEQYVPSSFIDTTQTPPQPINPYEVFHYSIDGTCPNATVNSLDGLGVLYVVNGEFHAYPGGRPLTTSEPYTNPGGPDITDISYRFFMAHPCTLRQGVCAPAA